MREFFTAEEYAQALSHWLQRHPYGVVPERGVTQPLLDARMNPVLDDGGNPVQVPIGTKFHNFLHDPSFGPDGLIIEALSQYGITVHAKSGKTHGRFVMWKGYPVEKSATRDKHMRYAIAFDEIYEKRDRSYRPGRKDTHTLTDETKVSVGTRARAFKNYENAKPSLLERGALQKWGLDATGPGIVQTEDRGLVGYYNLARVKWEEAKGTDNRPHAGGSGRGRGSGAESTAPAPLFVGYKPDAPQRRKGRTRSGAEGFHAQDDLRAYTVSLHSGARGPGRRAEVEDPPRRHAPPLDRHGHRPAPAGHHTPEVRERTHSRTAAESRSNRPAAPPTLHSPSAFMGNPYYLHEDLQHHPVAGRDGMNAYLDHLTTVLGDVDPERPVRPQDRASAAHRENRAIPSQPVIAEAAARGIPRRRTEDGASGRGQSTPAHTGLTVRPPSSRFGQGR